MEERGREESQEWRWKIKAKWRLSLHQVIGLLNEHTGEWICAANWRLVVVPLWGNKRVRERLQMTSMQCEGGDGRKGRRKERQLSWWWHSYSRRGERRVHTVWYTGDYIKNSEMTSERESGCTWGREKMHAEKMREFAYYSREVLLTDFKWNEILLRGEGERVKRQEAWWEWNWWLIKWRVQSLSRLKCIQIVGEQIQKHIK